MVGRRSGRIANLRPDSNGLRQQLAHSDQVESLEGTVWGADIGDVGTATLVGAGYASGIGEAKLIWDGVTYAGAALACRAGIIH